MGEFKTYSDGELKRLNAGIVKLEEQIARCMVIHQMLGNRISDTLTLHQDCLFKLGMQNMIVIHQPKSRMFEKPISEELALLIQKSINFTRQNMVKENIFLWMNKIQTSHCNIIPFYKKS